MTKSIKIKSLYKLNGKKVYFASDFHLGVPNAATSLEREKRIVRWLTDIQKDAAAIYLLGDIFDFWFEYRHAVPKGYLRLMGKLAEIVDSGIPVIFFRGNHDMWMFDYFPKELGIPVYSDPQVLEVEGIKLLIGHGDGLGPGDYSYKFLKKIFRSKLSQWLFARIHPNLGIALAKFWSRSSRISNIKKGEDDFKGEKEFLWAYCKEVEAETHHDYYVFGHRHLPLDLDVNGTSRYFNLGEWVNYNTYGVFDGKVFSLLTYEG